MNDTTEVSASGPTFKLSFSIKDEPLPTRTYKDVGQELRFYETDFEKLFNWYFAYKGSYTHRHRLLYSDLIFFRSTSLFAAGEPELSVEHVCVRFRSVDFRVPDELTQHKSAAIAEFKKLNRLKIVNGGEFEDDRTIRVNSIENGVFSCIPAKYSDQIGTNLTVDWCSGKLPDRFATLRQTIERPRAGRLVPLDKSGLANTLGTAVLFVLTGNRFVWRKRNQRMGSVNQAGKHPTVTGVVKLPESAVLQNDFDFDFFLHGTRIEIKNETGLDESDYRLFPLAFARELPRAGKPQLFFVAICDLTVEELICRLNSAEERYEFEDDDPKDLISEGDFNAAGYTYEGWAARIFVDDFFRANPGLRPT